MAFNPRRLVARFMNPSMLPESQDGTRFHRRCLSFKIASAESIAAATTSRYGGSFQMTQEQYLQADKKVRFVAVEFDVSEGNIPASGVRAVYVYGGHPLAESSVVLDRAQAGSSQGYAFKTMIQDTTGAAAVLGSGAPMIPRNRTPISRPLLFNSNPSYETIYAWNESNAVISIGGVSPNATLLRLHGWLIEFPTQLEAEQFDQWFVANGRSFFRAVSVDEIDRN